MTQTFLFLTLFFFLFKSQVSFASDYKHPPATGLVVCTVNSDILFDEAEEYFRDVYEEIKIKSFSVNLDTGSISGEINSEDLVSIVKNKGEIGSYIVMYSAKGIYRGETFLSNINVLKISTWLEYPDSSIATTILKEAKKPLIPPSKKMSFRLLWRDTFMVGTCSR
jgi:hypothetical protein